MQRASAQGPRKTMSTIREVLIPETEYQSLKSDKSDLLQTLLEHHLYNQSDIYYRGSPTAIRSHTLLLQAGLLEDDGTLTPTAKALPLYGAAL